MLCVTTYAYSFDFEADGIYYLADVSNMTATVTSGDSSYEGSIVIPETTSYKGRDFMVTSIESQTFLNCNNLVAVTLPESITSIGSGAFMNCANLTSINIPQNISNLSANCFNGCSSLESVNLPSSIIEIGSDCFANCNSLTAIAIPESVTSIGERAFLNCENLISIVLPNTINKLSKELFHNCSKLADFTIPNSIELIEDAVFENCKDLLSISIPANVREIGNGVFNGCLNIRNVKIEDSEEPITLGYGQLTERRYLGLFYNVPVETLYLGRNLSYPENESLFLDAHYEGYAPFQSCIIKEVAIGRYVTEIKPYTFYNCGQLDSIIIPNNVQSIGVYSFVKSGIRSFVINDGFKGIAFGVTENGDLTTLFMGCEKLEDIVIGRNITVSDKPSPGWMVSNDLRIKSLFPVSIKNVIIGNYVDELSFLQLYDGSIKASLSHYPNLEQFQVGYCIKYIPSLSDNQLLKSLVLCGVTPIDMESDDFSNSQYMDLEVNVPFDSINRYEEASVWSKFWNLKGVEDLHANVINVDEWLYGLMDSENNVELFRIPDKKYVDITVPETVNQDGKSYTVRSIGNVFQNNSEIVSIELPTTISQLDDNCFKDCVSLQTVNLKEGLKNIGAKAFNNCTSLEEISLPEGVENIGDETFNNCSSLQQINFNEDLKSIGAKAFKDCISLKTLSIPSTVEEFGVSAFDKCEFDTLVFEDGATELAFPHSDYSYDGFPGGWGGWKTYKCYFSNVSIKHLYIGRNIKNIHAPYVENIGSTTYYNMYEDPFYSVPSLEGITIGSDVSKIGSDLTEPINQGRSNNYRSFGGCKDIKTVNAQCETPPANAIFANNVYAEASLTVPENTKEAYQEAEGWKEFMNIFDGTEPVLVEEIKLNVTEMALEIGDTFQLTAEVLPEDATDQSVMWESSNPECVSVDENGLLTALAEGEAIITVRSTDGNCEASCQVSVIDAGGLVDAINSAMGGEYRVFNLQGIKVLESKDADMLKLLPKGVYIVNGKKIVIK